MKKLYIAAIMLSASAFAFATPGNNGNGQGGCGQGQQTNGCGNPGTDPTTPGNASANAGAVAGAIGVGVGMGGAGGAGGVSSSNSAAQGGAGGNATAAGGSGGSATGGSAAGGNGTGGAASAVGSVTFEGATYKEAASTAYAPDGKAPRTSCRLFVGFGGSSVNGSLSGGIPIGNDQTCMSGAMIEAMDKANKVQPNTFGIDDYLLAICAIEGMDKTKRCAK